MRILILSWRGPGHPNAGGAEQSTFEHAKGWARAGHKVFLFTSYYVGAKREEDIEGVNIIRRGVQFLGVQAETLRWYLFGSHKKFDFVIDEFHGIPFFTPLYVRAKKLAFIHEVTKEVWRLNPWPRPFNLLPWVLGTVLEPLVFQLLYKKIPFMTVSESTKDDLINWGIPKDNITVIHNGLSIPGIKKKFPKEKQKTAIFLGALSKDKGVEDAIKTFAIIDRRDPNWQFWIVGKGEEHYLEFLESLCNQLEIYKKVKFWGYVPEEKKFELLSRAHVLINPSVREGWGLVVIEAAAVGTPTAAFNVAGLRDSIIDDKTGILSSEHTVESLATKIIELLEDKKRYNRICHNAIVWSKNFSWTHSVEQSLSLLKRVYENA